MPPFRSGRAGNGALPALFALLLCSCLALGATPSPSPQKGSEAAKKGNALTRIPLPIGQEAKGLVLPDFDTEGRLRARFEAGAAKRLDTENVEFNALKMTTFSAQNAPDLLIEMPRSTLNLETQVITSHARTTVTRTDFTISGDSMRFDTVARNGTLVGNVKMVISGQTGEAGTAGQ